MLCIFWPRRFFYSPDLLQIFGLRTLGCNCWHFYQKNPSASSEALSLVNIFHRQGRRRSRSGESPDFFSSPQQSSTAHNSSSTKIPLLFQCFQPRSQSSGSGQWHSLFPAAGLGMGADGSQPGCPCSVKIWCSGHLYSQPESSLEVWLLLHLTICLEWLSFPLFFFFPFLIGKWLKVLPDLFILPAMPLPFY